MSGDDVNPNCLAFPRAAEEEELMKELSMSIVTVQLCASNTQQWDRQSFSCHAPRRLIRSVSSNLLSIPVCGRASHRTHSEPPPYLAMYHVLELDPVLFFVLLCCVVLMLQCWNIPFN